LEEELQKQPAEIRQVVNKHIHKNTEDKTNKSPKKPPKPNQHHLQLARKTIINFLEKCTRLYEQDAPQPRMSTYIRYWCIWSNLETFLDLIASAFGDAI